MPTTIDMVLHGFGMATSQGRIGYCGVTLLKGSKNILVDVAQVGRRGILVEKLKDRGMSPNDIDMVFLTHAHWDHSLNVDLFPNAEILIHPVERAYCKAPKETDWATPKWTTLMLEAQKLREVKEGEEIDDGVTVIETPGHSKGSMALLVRTADGTAAISGDALPDGWSVGSKMPRLIFGDVDQAKASLRKLLDRAQTFYPGHDRPFKVEDGGGIRYLEKTSIAIMGWPDPGIGESVGGVNYTLEPERQTGIVT